MKSVTGLSNACAERTLVWPNLTGSVNEWVLLDLDLLDQRVESVEKNS
jgi:hypothetical protein